MAVVYYMAGTLHKMLGIWKFKQKNLIQNPGVCIENFGIPSLAIAKIVNPNFSDTFTIFMILAMHCDIHDFINAFTIFMILAMDS
jgi:hypothetical protein